MRHKFLHCEDTFICVDRLKRHMMKQQDSVRSGFQPGYEAQQDLDGVFYINLKENFKLFVLLPS